ncbi:hypothetical protein [Paenibacillus silvisoli]|uniref:hypothetical protein n=1 Tax=Paenibacillus silvisoli TaxID=3110539 RepID=UPI002804FDA1|nr:hypothetical protein [Paenibacillus silvisoli]
MLKQSTQETAAKELATYLSDNHQKYIARAYNRFNEENSEWFVLLAKGSDPAYQYGKFSIIPSDKGFQASFYIEKGFNIPLEIAKSSSVINKLEIMNEKWQWQNLMDDIKHSELKLDDNWEIELQHYEFGKQSEIQVRKFPGSTLLDIAEKFTKPTYDYHWINLYISPLNDENDIHKLYDNYLSRFIKWIK